MYKIQLRFLDLPFKPYYKYSEKLIFKIREKVNSKEIVLRFIPTKEMIIDISTYKIHFEFTKREMEAINDCNQQYDITDIVITSSNIELWLD